MAKRQSGTNDRDIEAKAATKKNEVQEEDAALDLDENLLDLPPELHAQIAEYLPIDGFIANIGLCRKSAFTSLLLRDPAFGARLVQRHSREFVYHSLRSGKESDDDIVKLKWEWLQRANLTGWPTLRALPLPLRAAVYAYVINLPELSGVRSFKGNPSESPMFYRNWIMPQASASRVARHLLHAGFDFSVQKNRYFRWAARSGHLDVVQLLSTLPNVNPRDDNDYALKCSCETGQTEIVKLLLGLGCDPAAEHNVSLMYAAEFGHADVMRLLLDDARVDPSEDGWNAFGLACGSDAPDCVDHLLKHSRCNIPLQTLHEGLVYACSFGAVNVVQWLLRQSTVDPGWNDNTAVLACVENGKVEPLRILMTEKRVTLKTRHLTDCIVLAAQSQYADILELLLESVSPSTPQL
ncbi:ankyrin repeat-containing domain protein [Chytriomyces sp. MP71]|nr:ankyrin repeat-containing domain protein [Chytriomyces sp. MP71]